MKDEDEEEEGGLFLDKENVCEEHATWDSRAVEKRAENGFLLVVRSSRQKGLRERRIANITNTDRRREK